MVWSQKLFSPSCRDVDKRGKSCLMASCFSATCKKLYSLFVYHLLRFLSCIFFTPAVGAAQLAAKGNVPIVIVVWFRFHGSFWVLRFDGASGWMIVHLSFLFPCSCTNQCMVHAASVVCNCAYAAVRFTVLWCAPFRFNLNMFKQ